jgi:phosphoglucosamine mutase
MVDRDGRAFDGDQLLYVIAMDYRRRKALTGGVVGTVMTNLGLEQALAREGIALERAAVGDRYVLEKLRGSAGSSAARIPAHPVPRQAHDRRRNHRRARGPARAGRAKDDARGSRGGHHALSATTDQRARAEGLRLDRQRRDLHCAGGNGYGAGRHGRVLLRPSGTEPVLRVMVEAREAGSRTGTRRRWPT